ncbi:proton-coupled amino acid transporter-like protein pathetic [Bombyx mori]|uniref:Amino acid transporter transmembrane domain-containing protein n=1 Tax=Bombyx mori TaxID=7091 RepID=A0A8R2G8F4_BOMMO|nr:proton-coupled amino acid transporter-like protein pathetic [Bombyx mori]XP_037870740.1 proton-coupled amino acid transporter-like protein pathetic [Bombyx mori]
MGGVEKKDGIVLNNFNSTANLTSNSGFQSTLTLGSKEVINEKAYDPFEHRNVEHPTSTMGSLAHLLKSSLGSGVLAMPAAFKNAGLVMGVIGNIFIGFICTHCVYVLVKTSQEVCVEAKKPSMGFAETCGAAFEFGPKKLRPWSNFVRIFVDYALTCTYLAALCVYVVFIAENFKQVLDVYAPNDNLSVQAYCALTLVPLVLMSQIRNLKWLVPFSAIANVFLVICFGITLYYIFKDLPVKSEATMVASVSKWPLFISTVVFAMEGIGVVMPIENEMAKPQHFLGCPGVLNVAMTVVVTLYGLVGLFGYMTFGDTVHGSVTLNLPKDDVLAQAAKILMALAILFTYSLQLYVPMEMIWRQLKDKITVRYHNITQIAIRTAAVVGSVILAAAIPNLELVINLCGAIFLSTLGLLTPAIVDTVHNWDRGLGFFYWKLFKNIFIAMISLLAFFAGTFIAIQDMVNKISADPVLEKHLNTTRS